MWRRGKEGVVKKWKVEVEAMLDLANNFMAINIEIF